MPQILIIPEPRYYANRKLSYTVPYTKKPEEAELKG